MLGPPLEKPLMALGVSTKIVAYNAIARPPDLPHLPGMRSKGRKIHPEGWPGGA